MEIQQPTTYLITTILSFAIGYFFSYFLSKGKISAIQNTYKVKLNECESDLKIQDSKYKNLESAYRQLESSLNSALSIEIEKNKTLDKIIDDLRKAAKHVEDSHEEKIEALRASYEEKLDALRKEELTVITYPYDEQIGDDGFFSDDRKAEIGYKFQLFIKGVPCFEPHKVPVQVLQKKEVNLDKIKEIKNIAIDTIEKIASMHPAVKALSSAPDAIKAIKR